MLAYPLWCFGFRRRRRLLRRRRDLQLVGNLLHAVGLFSYAFGFSLRLGGIDRAAQGYCVIDYVDVNLSFRRISITNQLGDNFCMNPGVFQRLSDSLFICLPSLALFTLLLFTVF